jgi:hypothetical protein
VTTQIVQIILVFKLRFSVSVLSLLFGIAFFSYFLQYRLFNFTFLLSSLSECFHDDLFPQRERWQKHSSSKLLHWMQALLCLPPAFTLDSFFAYSSTPKMETTCSSETSVDLQPSTRRYIPEDRTLQQFLYWKLALISLKIWSHVQNIPCQESWRTNRHRQLSIFGFRSMKLESWSSTLFDFFIAFPSCFQTNDRIILWNKPRSPKILTIREDISVSFDAFINWKVRNTSIIA